MSTPADTKYRVAVIGAGPAGLFAAQTLAEEGAHVALVNRDIKPGGLAEYGIYPNKLKMKGGLRKQFDSILDDDRIEYYGNVRIAEDGGDIKLSEFLDMDFQAVLITVGAQGTKWLGLPGEEHDRVYHAKDLVYHYNHLPPFSERDYDIGDVVALIGVGNVMCDIAHWCVRDLKVDEVIAVARRGPAEVKFTKKEFSIFARNMDMDALDAEFEKMRPNMEELGQDIEAAREFIMSGWERGQEPVSDTRFRFDFCASPSRILADDEGVCRGLEVEETRLMPRGEDDTKPEKTGETRVIDCDTVVFCIGDQVDEAFGLPVKWNEFAKNPEPRYPVEDLSYEAWDPEAEEPFEGVFLAGWARKASEGLVGAARKDGTNGAHAVLQYLEDRGPTADTGFDELESRLARLDKHVVRKDDLPKLLEVEARIAEERGLEEFKFDSDEEMLAAIGVAEPA